MHSLKKHLALLIALLSFMAASVAADMEAPDDLIKRVSQEILDAATTDKQIQAGNQQRIMALVQETIIPHVDFQRMTAMAAGRFWRDASPEQQTSLTAEFKTLLVYTYAGAITQVRNQKIDFRPMRNDPADTEVEVRSMVLQQRGEPIQLSYRLEKTPSGWKIYDVNILGAWLVETYKSSFASEISKGGIDGLIKTLSERNKRLAAASARTVRN